MHYVLKMNGTSDNPKYRYIDDVMTDIFIEHPAASFTDWRETKEATWRDIVDGVSVIGRIFEIED